MPFPMIVCKPRRVNRKGVPFSLLVLSCLPEDMKDAMKVLIVQLRGCDGTPMDIRPQPDIIGRRKYRRPDAAHRKSGGRFRERYRWK